MISSLSPGQPARINDAGEIAGRLNVMTSPTSGTQHAAVRSSNGAWLDLGVLEDDTVSAGFGINNAGVVVGFSGRTFSFSDARYRAVRSANGTLQAIPELVGKDAFPYAINNLGKTCGMMGPLDPDSNKPWHAFIADDATVVDLHAAVGAALGYDPLKTVALSINLSGDVVGQAEKPFVQTRGFVYRSGAVSILTGVDGSGGAWSLYAPTAINDSGLVAGIALISPPANPPLSQARAVIYDTTGGTLTPLPAPPGPGSIVRSEAFDIDAAGRVVGSAHVQLSPTSSRSLAFLYENGQMLDLNTLIPAGSGWDLQSAMAMNNVGQIVGSGKFGGESGHYFLLTPANEPPTVTLAGPLSVPEGSAATVTASATDPESGPLVYEWDLDGLEGYEVTNANDEMLLDPAGDDGPATRPVGVRVTDQGGLKATASTTIDILNAAPTATFVASATTVYVNTAVSLELINPVDPSGADTVAGFSYEWDCDNAGFASGAATHGCAYTTGGPHTARARITDKDGGFSGYEVEIYVRTAQEGIAGLIQTVTSFGLPKGMENSFLTKLEHAMAAGDPAAACGDLQDFINHAQAQSGKALATLQATQIISEAEAIRTALGCA